MSPVDTRPIDGEVLIIDPKAQGETFLSKLQSMSVIPTNQPKDLGWGCFENP